MARDERKPDGRPTLRELEAALPTGPLGCALYGLALIFVVWLIWEGVKWVGG